MHSTLLRERTLTQIDHARLTGLLARDHDAAGAWIEAIQEMLDASELVPSPEVGATVVTMYSQVQLEDQDGSCRTITLCYPKDSDPAAGQLSVLSPIGAALLGLRVGETAHWQLPSGAGHSARIVAVLFQPEAAGDYLR